MCDILADVLEGRVDRRPLAATTARPLHGERALAVGPGWRPTWRALGNGQYTHGIVMAFGRPSFVIGSMVGSAIGNAARRRQAERDAGPRWIPGGPGEVTLTPHRLHFAHPAQLDLERRALSAVELVAADVLQSTFFGTDGRQAAVRLRTPWASPAFTLGAVAAFPAHPCLLSRGRLPPGFEQRCAQHGRPCRPAAELALRAGGLQAGTRVPVLVCT
ncbi:hypothetical protein [Streptomyces sp. NPDC058739]|uniref:hypothetical protein n=1 Tax=Streptomyces sp. NPDC058739 TaxID=3346618 RepID=UPI00368EBC28